MLFRSKGFDGKELVLPVDSSGIATDWSTVVQWIERSGGVTFVKDAGLLFMLRAILVVMEVLKGVERRTEVGDRGIIMGEVYRVVSAMQNSISAWKSCWRERKLIDGMWMRLRMKSVELCDEREMMEVTLDRMGKEMGGLDF